MSNIHRVWDENKQNIAWIPRKAEQRRDQIEEV